MEFRLKKDILDSGSFEDSARESAVCIKNMSPIERLQILEFLRAQTYVESSPGLQRIIEVIEGPKSRLKL